MESSWQGQSNSLRYFYQYESVKIEYLLVGGKKQAGKKTQQRFMPPVGSFLLNTSPNYLDTKSERDTK